MSFLRQVLDRVKPVAAVTDDKIIGVTNPDALSHRYFGKMKLIADNAKRFEMYDTFNEMKGDGALADKVLERLCADATMNPIQINAPSRRKKVIEEMLRQVRWNDKSSDLAYLFFSNGDLFLQKIFAPSTNPKRLGYITDIISMPPSTMIRNHNDKDQFDVPEQAYYQVDDIRNGTMSRVLYSFPEGKIVHARNDYLRSHLFGYGRGIWFSAVRIFNMVMTLLEDSVYTRHQTTQNIRVHRIGKESPVGVNEMIVKDYTRKIDAVLRPDTTDLMIDGKTVIEQIGGPKSVMSGVDDIRLMISILSVALDYPIDLMSGGVSDDSGGEELFRKEVVLARTIQRLMNKLNALILIPLIETELALAGANGPYEIVTQPVTFEDKSKKSKRGIMELQSGAISKQTYYEENKTGRTWKEEQKRLKKEAEFDKELAEIRTPDELLQPELNPDAGERGNRNAPDGQQQRTTPGAGGTDDRE